MSELEPITRTEMFLAAAGGQSVELPEPITREEVFLKAIAEGGGGGGGGVTDVQVDGSSVVSGGVANVPVASTSTYGVVRLQQYGGLQTGSSNLLKIDPAAESAIKQGTDGSRPIVPSRQHFATFYGLAKAAGDTTQSAFSNEVGTYTDEAKVAIQKMLGIYKGPYRLIKEITISEETGNIYVIADDNNNPFALVDMIFHFENVVATASGDASISVNSGTAIIGATFPSVTVSNLYNTTAQTRVARVSVDGGKFIGEATNTNLSSTYTAAGLTRNLNASGVIQCGAITEFCIGSLNSHKFTSGTIKVYGR